MSNPNYGKQNPETIILGGVEGNYIEGRMVANAAPIWPGMLLTIEAVPNTVTGPAEYAIQLDKASAAANSNGRGAPVVAVDRQFDGREVYEPYSSSTSSNLQPNYNAAGSNGPDTILAYIPTKGSDIVMLADSKLAAGTYVKRSPDDAGAIAAVADETEREIVGVVVKEGWPVTLKPGYVDTTSTATTLSTPHYCIVKVL